MTAQGPRGARGRPAQVNGARPRLPGRPRHHELTVIDHGVAGGEIERTANMSIPGAARQRRQHRRQQRAGRELLKGDRPVDPAAIEREVGEEVAAAGRREGQLAQPEARGREVGPQVKAKGEDVQAEVANVEPARHGVDRGTGDRPGAGEVEGRRWPTHLEAETAAARHRLQGVGGIVDVRAQLDGRRPATLGRSEDPGEAAVQVQRRPSRGHTRRHQRDRVRRGHGRGHAVETRKRERQLHARRRVQDRHAPTAARLGIVDLEGEQRRAVPLPGRRADAGRAAGRAMGRCRQLERARRINLRQCQGPARQIEDRVESVQARVADPERPAAGRFRHRGCPRRTGGATRGECGEEADVVAGLARLPCRATLHAREAPRHIVGLQAMHGDLRPATLPLDLERQPPGPQHLDALRVTNRDIVEDQRRRTTTHERQQRRPGPAPSAYEDLAAHRRQHPFDHVAEARTAEDPRPGDRDREAQRQQRPNHDRDDPAAAPTRETRGHGGRTRHVRRARFRADLSRRRAARRPRRESHVRVQGRKDARPSRRWRVATASGCCRSR